MEFLYEYGLFFAKAATVVVAVGLVVGLLAGAASKNRSSKRGELSIDDISKQKAHELEDIQHLMMSKEEAKEAKKLKKAEQKQAKKEKDEPEGGKPKLFVVNFNGNVDAAEVENLREEITSIIRIADKKDRVLINLESPGGVVHGYGLAASQIDRLKKAEIEIVAAVDKVAASGGYMMACVADKIIAAPFSIIGSIGVVAQLPNINRLLKKNDIDIEQHTAGNYKRTLTVLGENTDEARDKFKQELAETHELFKDFVKQHREQVDIEKVATGEHWYGTQAKELNLVDEIQTSDDYLLEALESHQIYKVEYRIKQNLAEKIGVAAESSFSRIFSNLANWSITKVK